MMFARGLSSVYSLGTPKGHKGPCTQIGSLKRTIRVPLRVPLRGFIGYKGQGPQEDISIPREPNTLN